MHAPTRALTVAGMMIVALACGDARLMDEGESESDGSTTQPSSETATSSASGDGDPAPGCDCEPDELCVGRSAPGAMCGGPTSPGPDCNFCEDPASRVLGCVPRPPSCPPEQDPCAAGCSIPICDEALCSDACEGIVEVDLWCTGLDCDSLAQDCPADERCLPYKLVDGLDRLAAPYIALSCTPTTGAAMVGEPCSRGPLTSSADDCGPGSICWNLVDDGQGYAGVCHELCMLGACASGVCVHTDPWLPMYSCEASCANGEPCPLGEMCIDVGDYQGNPARVCVPFQP